MGRSVPGSKGFNSLPAELSLDYKIMVFKL